MIKRFLVLPLVAAMCALSAPSAWADTSYNNMIVSQLSAAHRVVVDRNADPALPEPEAINNQIVPTGLPLYVVNIAKNQTDPHSMDSDGAVATLPIKNALYATHNPITNPIKVPDQNGNPVDHNPPLIILVIDGNGYHARAYDVTQSIADAAGPKIKQSAAEHSHNLYGTVSAYISMMASTPSTGPVVSNVPPPPPPPQPTNWAFAWGILWFFVSIVALGALGFVVRFFYRGHQDRVERRDRVRNRINRVRADLVLLAEEVLKGEDVSQANNRAQSAMADADDALARGDLSNAASYVGIAEEQIQQAYRGLSHEMPSHSHVGVFEDVLKKHDRKKAKVTATSPKGNRVTIDNADYRTRSEAGYRNHLDRGGMYNGAYFNPGYYPYPFWGSGWGWSPTDVILMDEVLRDRRDSSYSDYHHDYSGGGSAGVGSGSGRHSGGGSAGFSSPAPSHHHSSSSGSSSGGGSTSFGGFGGGGFGGFGGGGGGDSSGGGSAGF